jgi:hypothetical protein
MEYCAKKPLYSVALPHISGNVCVYNKYCIFGNNTEYRDSEDEILELQIMQQKSGFSLKKPVNRIKKAKNTLLLRHHIFTLKL